MHVDQTERIDNPEAPAKKRGRPPKKPTIETKKPTIETKKPTIETKKPTIETKKPTIETIDLSDLNSGAVTRGYIPVAIVERYRAEVANHETLDDARKNYALDLLDRLLAELRG